MWGQPSSEAQTPSKHKTMTTPNIPEQKESANAGCVRRLVSLFHRKPKPEEAKPMWEGKCACCGGRVYSMSRIPAANEAVECSGCSLELTDAGKKRASERRQIELIKTAFREIEAEKAHAKCPHGHATQAACPACLIDNTHQNSMNTPETEKDLCVQNT